MFLSIGYAACHWCHVMAHESFEDPSIAALLNEHFVPVKVDREERPDLDHLYMSATIAMTGSGGWPMSIFLTPAGEPFFAGTYFPPQPRYGLPSFRQVLESVLAIWRTHPTTVANVASRIRLELQRHQLLSQQRTDLSPTLLLKAADTLCEQHDSLYGGWGPAPKFPQPMALDFLLRRHLDGHPHALSCVTLSLRAMARGGIYDVIGGGFARYATDAAWLIPHFEKMLYDNALLARIYLHAWLCTRDPFFRRIAEETLTFLQRELALPTGCFASSLDADADGKEGSFYVWSAHELARLLGPDWPLFQRAYAVTNHGNWEGVTILQRALDDVELAASFNLTPHDVHTRLAACHARLLAARNQRPRPLRDDKIITSWNAFTLATFAAAGRFLDPCYTAVAQQHMHSLLRFLRPAGVLRHSCFHGDPSPHVFLEDFAALILALLELFQADADISWYRIARDLASEMIARFADSDGGFFDTPHDAPQLLLRPKQLQDNATPCGNSLAAEALLILAHFTGDSSLRSRAEHTVAPVASLAAHYPLGFAHWLCAFDWLLLPEELIAIVGPSAHPATKALLAFAHQTWSPRRLVASAPEPPPPDAPPWLAHRSSLHNQPTLYR
ncbi:MAG: thioredoxin domain-containing protein, partial [bacterium]|nr:thioredoxin domain-containing protein [bacterium]